MAWNRPRKRKIQPRQVTEVFLVKEEYTKRETKRLRLRKPVFDPRPVHLRLPDVEEVNRFVDDLKVEKPVPLKHVDI